MTHAVENRSKRLKDLRVFERVVGVLSLFL